jgi:hypothetical protein
MCKETYTGRLLDNSSWITGTLFVDNREFRTFINPFFSDEIEYSKDLTEEWFEVQVNTVTLLEEKEFKYDVNNNVRTYFGDGEVVSRERVDYDNYYTVKLVSNKKTKTLTFIEEQLSPYKEKK